MMSLSKDPAKMMNIRIKSFVGNFALTWIFWLRIFLQLYIVIYDMTFMFEKRILGSKLFHNL